MEALDRYALTNVVSIKDLRSFVGRANHAAGLLVTIRPFLHAIWKAMSCSGTAPCNTIWTKQIEHALKWLRCFFKHNAPGITRQFNLEECRGNGTKIELGTDASPWGIGGWLSVNGEIQSYFYDKVSEEDLSIFGIVRGSCEGQQTLEGLAILVALRTWNHIHDSQKFRLQVRGDNVGGTKSPTADETVITAAGNHR